MTPLNRRQLLKAIPGLALISETSAGRRTFRLGICHDVFEGWPLVRVCRETKKLGYAGLELAPHALSDDPAAIPVTRRRQIRKTLEQEGMSYIGVHGVLKSPVAGNLHLTTDDAAKRQESWDYLRRLVELCADFGDGGILVFGARRARSTLPGSSQYDGLKRLEEGLLKLAPEAQDRGVTLAVEPLAPHLSDMISTLEEALSLVKQVNHPAVQAMFDVHNSVGEKTPPAEFLGKSREHLCHVHLNEMDGRHPGTGSYDFEKLLEALASIDYRGWLSVEVFDLSPGGLRIASESVDHLRRQGLEIMR